MQGLVDVLKAHGIGGAGGDAVPADVRTGKTFVGANGPQTGTLPQVAGGNTITPTTTAQTAIAAETIAEAAISVQGDTNLVAANIRHGASVFGVAGSYQAQVAHGSVTSVSGPSGTFYETNGTAHTNTYYAFEITPPAGANQILAVIIEYAPSSTSSDHLVAIPAGGLDGIANCVCTTEEGSTNKYTSWEAGGVLSLTPSSIVLPWAVSGQTLYYTIVYV